MSPAHRQTGHAHLRFERVGDRTRLTRASTHPPLAVMRTLHLDEEMPDLAVAYLLNTTAGIFQGDRLCTEVTAASGARVHLTTPSATKVFSMPNGEALTSTRLVVGEGALVEYLPEPLIPFAGARLRQQVTLSVHAGGTLLYADTAAPGRTGMGERFAYDHYGQRLTLDDGTGAVAYAEAFDLRPHQRPLQTLGVLGSDATAIATIIAVVPDGAEVLLTAVRRTIAACAGVTAGATSLPASRGVAVRLLAAEAPPLRQGVQAVWAAFRQASYGVGVTRLRK